MYEVYHRAYGWTVAEIDNTEMDYILTLNATKADQAEPDDPNTTTYFLTEE